MEICFLASFALIHAYSGNFVHSLHAHIALPASLVEWAFLVAISARIVVSSTIVEATRWQVLGWWLVRVEILHIWIIVNSKDCLASTAPPSTKHASEITLVDILLSILLIAEEIVLVRAQIWLAFHVVLIKSSCLS
jgi:hypothetical protein